MTGRDWPVRPSKLAPGNTKQRLGANALLLFVKFLLTGVRQRNVENSVESVKKTRFFRAFPPVESVNSPFLQKNF